MPTRITAFLLAAGATCAAEAEWTGFRGGTGNSTTSAAGLPVEWAHDRNIAWKVVVPGVGQSTPVVFGGRIFVTSVEGPKKEKLNLFALDLASGKVVWQRQMASSRPHPMGDRVSRAAPTPAVEADRLYALFDSGDVFAFTLAGERQWHVNLNERFGVIQPGHDFGSSLRLAGGRLYAHISQATPSYLVSLRKTDGATAWHNAMPREGGYGTPVAARLEGRDVLLASSQGGVVAYDAETGQEIWKQVREGARGGGIPSVTVAQGLAVVASAAKGHSFAVRLADPARRAWTADAAATQYSSPLVHSGRVYMVNAVGVLFVLDLATGKQLSAQRLPGPTWASAIGAGDSLYFFTTDGATVVMRAGDQPKKLSENVLPVAGTVYAATPVEKALLIRTGTELWKVADVGAVVSFATPETAPGLTRTGGDTTPAPRPPAGVQPGDRWTNQRDRQVYVLVPAGRFTMGCAKEQCQPDEAGQREAAVERPFWLGRTEVPVAAYRTFAAQTGARLPEEPMLLDRSLNPRWRNARLPILNMTAPQAEGYCAWVGGRLPTELEWEFAARANTDAAPSASQVWSAENAGAQPLSGPVLQMRRGIEEKLYENGNTPYEVGTREENAFGLADMLGNAGEWTSGMFEDHPPVIRGGPPTPPGTPFRVSRGGSFTTPLARTRPTSRQRHTLDGRMESVGFRCVIP